MIISQVEAVVRDIGLDLPDGETCEGLELESPVRCDEDGDKLIIEGPFELDLMTATARPSLSDVSIPAGTYRRVDLRIDADGDAALRLVGEMPADQGSTPVELALPVSEDARFEHPDGIAVGDGSSLLALLDLDVLLGEVSLQRCIHEDHADRTSVGVFIDGSSCDDVVDAVEEVLKERWDLVDGSGPSEAPEDDGPEDHD